MKRSFTVLMAVLIIIAMAVIFLVYAGGENNSTSEQTQQPLSVPTNNANGETSTACDSVSIIAPLRNQKVSSPLTVEVVVDNTNASCLWTVFEAQAGIMTIQTENGDILGQGILMTGEDWMQEGPVNYHGEIEFTQPTDNSGIKLVIEEENPSGLDSPVIIPIPLAL